MSELPLASRKTVEEQIQAILIDELSILEDRTFARVERRLLAVVNADREAHNQQLEKMRIDILESLRCVDEGIPLTSEGVDYIRKKFEGLKR